MHCNRSPKPLPFGWYALWFGLYSPMVLQQHVQSIAHSLGCRKGGRSLGKLIYRRRFLPPKECSEGWRDCAELWGGYGRSCRAGETAERLWGGGGGVTERLWSPQSPMALHISSETFPKPLNSLPAASTVSEHLEHGERGMGEDVGECLRVCMCLCVCVCVCAPCNSKYSPSLHHRSPPPSHECRAYKG